MDDDCQKHLLNTTRAWGFLLTICVLAAGGGLAFFYGDKLTSSQLQLITTIVVLIGGSLKSADGFFYDGTPKQEKDEKK